VSGKLVEKGRGGADRRTRRREGLTGNRLQALERRGGDERVQAPIIAASELGLLGWAFFPFVKILLGSQQTAAVLQHKNKSSDIKFLFS
jgi:hypothetical protein